jgi:hypothetical protein
MLAGAVLSIAAYFLVPPGHREATRLLLGRNVAALASILMVVHMMAARTARCRRNLRSKMRVNRWCRSWRLSQFAWQRRPLSGELGSIRTWAAPVEPSIWRSLLRQS